MARIALEEIAEELNDLRNTGYKYDLPETYTKEELLTMFLIIEIQEINWSFRSLNENLQLLRRQLEHGRYSLNENFRLLMRQLEHR